MSNKGYFDLVKNVQPSTLTTLNDLLVLGDQIIDGSLLVKGITTLNDLKKMYKSSEEAKTERPKKIYISFTILLPITTRMCGKPAKCG